MHIVHIYKDYFPILGGIENHLRALAEGQAARGHRVTVLVTNTTNQEQRSEQGNLTIIKAARRFHAASTPLSPAMLRHASALKDVELVHLHFPFPPGDLAALVVPGAPPLVVSYHSDIVRQQSLLLAYRPLQELTLRRAARIISYSPDYIRSSPVLRRFAAKCRVAPLSVAVERFATLDSSRVAELRNRYNNDVDTTLLLFVGRLRYYKGLHVLLEALARCRRPAQLLLVGIGPEEARLRAQRDALGLSTQVYFLGEVDDVELPLIYAASDVFVLPSHLRAEGFGIVQIEAQAAGLPTICTELGTGTSYVTQHAVTGIVVPPADADAFAKPRRP
ncbi:glycosyltransferase, partial [Candidatus Gracilibacteria bacterium]|nr:glycosyltransferase [Candidatus Gracilibacteria bacterium]